MTDGNRYEQPPSNTARKALRIAVAALVIAILALLLASVDLFGGP